MYVEQLAFSFVGLCNLILGVWVSVFGMFEFGSELQGSVP